MQMLDNQIDRAYGQNKCKTMRQTKPTKDLVFVEAEVEEISDKGHMIETGEATLPLGVDLGVIVIQWSHTKDKKIIEIEVTVDSRGLEVNLGPQLEGLELYQGLSAETKIDASFADSLVTLPKNSMRRTHLQANCIIQKNAYPSTKDVPIFMKVIQKMKTLWQQCVMMQKLTVPSK